MSVEELVKRHRNWADINEKRGESMAAAFNHATADKLEELAAENERLKREAEAHYDAGHYRAMSEHATPQRIRADKAEAALAEAKRENEALRAACNQSRLAFAGMVSVQSAIDKLDTLPRNAGGNDEPCHGCGDGDKVPASGYWLCPVCDAEWSGEDAK